MFSPGLGWSSHQLQKALILSKVFGLEKDLKNFRMVNSAGSSRIGSAGLEEYRGRTGDSFKEMSGIS